MKNFLKNSFRFLWKIIKWFLFLSIISVIIFRFVPVPVTPLMIIRCVEQKINGKELKLKKNWTSIQSMSAAMPLAAMAAEDQKFEEHFGFDLEAIEKAKKY